MTANKTPLPPREEAGFPFGGERASATGRSRCDHRATRCGARGAGSADTTTQRAFAARGDGAFRSSRGWQAALAPVSSAGSRALRCWMRRRSLRPAPSIPTVSTDDCPHCLEDSGKTRDDEANLSTESNPPTPHARVPRAHEDGRWTQRAEAAPREGSQAAGCDHALQVAMTSGTGRFRRSDRLRSSLDYRRVSSAATRISSREFVVLLAPAGPQATGRARLGVTASRRVGNAVARNRVKRAIRGWFRTCKAKLPVGDRGLDIVVIARREAAELDAERVSERLCQLVGERLRARTEGRLTGATRSLRR